MHAEEFGKVLLGFIQVILLFIAGYAATEMKEISASINELNVKIAVLLSESQTQRVDIGRLERRIEKLEQEHN